MERSREYEDVAAVLLEMRPAPRTDFAAELDELAAAGFPPRPHARRSPLASLAARFSGLSPQRLLFTTGGTALAAIAIATVVVASLDSEPGPAVVEQHVAKQPSKVQFSEEMPRGLGAPRESSSAAAGATNEDSSAAQLAPEALSNSSVDQARPGRPHRDIERSAEISLLADPADVAADSAKVFGAVHDVDGIVLHSSSTAGRNARADFDLLIPSAKLGDALAAFSAIDEVRTRHETTADITAPTVALEERLQDSRAKIDSLVSQLSAAETEAAMKAIEVELRGERRYAAGLRSQLDRLYQRADFSRVSLRIETGASTTSNGGGWGIDDAFHDAGHILAVAAGVTVVALAVIAPLALICLLAWLAHRLWLRSRRERVLDA